LALFGRRLSEREDGLGMPASENLHTTRLVHRSNDEAMSSFRQACGLQSPGGYLIAEFWA
jgi:hypothetical protein